MSKGVVFGRDLSDLVQGNEIPALVEDCINWIENQALDEEGLFRIPGDTKHIKKLKDMYEAAGPKGHIDLNSEKGLTPHSVAGLLKLFMRELPEPLFMFRYYESFIQVVRNPDTETRVRSLRNVVRGLPPINKTIVIYLLQFLQKFSQHSSSNKMSLINIAVCWAPNLLRSKEESYEKIMREASLVNEVFTLLIENIQFIALEKEDLMQSTLNQASPTPIPTSPNLTRSTSDQASPTPIQNLMQSTPNLSSNNLMQSQTPVSPTLSPRQPQHQGASSLMSSQPVSSPNVQRVQGSDWREAVTKEGRKYYFNVVTRQTSWTLPDGIAKQPENKQEPKSQETESLKEAEKQVEEKPAVSENSPITEQKSETENSQEVPKTENETPKETPTSPKVEPKNNRPVKAQPTGYVNPAATNTLSIPQLKGMLDELGISYSSSTSRNELVKLVMENFTVNLPPPISETPRKSQF